MGSSDTRLLGFTYGNGGRYQENRQSKCRSWLQAGWAQQDFTGPSTVCYQERRSHCTGLCNKTPGSPVVSALSEKKVKIDNFYPDMKRRVLTPKSSNNLFSSFYLPYIRDSFCNKVTFWSLIHPCIHKESLSNPILTQNNFCLPFTHWSKVRGKQAWFKLNTESSQKGVSQQSLFGLHIHKQTRGTNIQTLVARLKLSYWNTMKMKVKSLVHLCSRARNALPCMTLRIHVLDRKSLKMKGRIGKAFINFREKHQPKASPLQPLLTIGLSNWKSPLHFESLPMRHCPAFHHLAVIGM